MQENSEDNTVQVTIELTFFFCASEKLVIELDGNPHAEYHKIEKDKKRDQYLEGLGFSILRFENRLVFQEPEFVKNEIRKTFKRKDTEFK